MQKTNKHGALVALLTIFLLAGCEAEKKGPELGTVRGVVTLDGKPLKKVVVMFTPVGNGGSSTAETDQDGKFSLQYSASEFGAIPGEHIVSVQRENVEGEGGNAAEFSDVEPEEDPNYTEDFEPENDEQTQAPTRPESSGILIPTIYNDKKSSPIRVTVKTGMNEIPIELKSE